MNLVQKAIERMQLENRINVAAIVPCFNEEAAVAKVVKDLQVAVPGIHVYVFDNGSTDSTAQVAREAGAEVRIELRRGKGNVVRRAFADIEADVYLLIDGDDTYDASAASNMIETLVDMKLDHVLGCRRQAEGTDAYRPGHSAGNKAFNRLVSFLFGERVTDMFSGYRVFSRRFVKSFPAISKGFEIETELTVHSMDLRVPQHEVPVGFKDRAEGSSSKLKTFEDGFKILYLVLRLLMHERPLGFYGLFSFLFLILSLALGMPVVLEYSQTGLVERLPTALLAVSVGLLSAISLMLGAIMTGILKARREVMRLSYLQFPSISIRAR